MPAQYDLYRPEAGALVVILQSDLLDQLSTRVVAPLLPKSAGDRVLRTLNPEVRLGEDTYLVMPQLSATLTIPELGERIGSLAAMRDEMMRALDALTSEI